jgi:poly [ADP-ribose] polymerase 2/3/4
VADGACRVGETGQVKTVDFADLDGAKTEYGKRFKSKTGLAWENRTDEPKANKYTFIERAYEDDADDGDDAAASNGDAKQPQSQLDMATQRLMELIFKYGTLPRLLLS